MVDALRRTSEIDCGRSLGIGVGCRRESNLTHVVKRLGKPVGLDYMLESVLIALVSYQGAVAECFSCNSLDALQGVVGIAHPQQCVGRNVVEK